MAVLLCNGPESPTCWEKEACRPEVLLVMPEAAGFTDCGPMLLPEGPLELSSLLLPCLFTLGGSGLQLKWRH